MAEQLRAVLAAGETAATRASRDSRSAYDLLSYHAEYNPCRVAGATTDSVGGGRCIDPLTSLSAAAGNVRSAVARLRSAVRAAQGVVNCRRSEQEIAFVARQTARGSYEAAGDLPNALDSPVTIAGQQCSSTQQVANSLPQLVGGVNAVLVADRSSVERSVIAQWVAESASRHGGSTEGLGDRMNDFLGRLNANAPDEAPVASTGGSNLQGGQAQAVEP